MYAQNFIYNNIPSQTYGVIICSFDGSENTASGGEIQVNSALAPGRDTYDFYGRQFSDPLSWSFSICKNPSVAKDDMFFTHAEERHIARWLLGAPGYHTLKFCDGDYEEISYDVCFNMTPHQINGKTAGFDLTATCRHGYGFGQTLFINGRLNRESPIDIQVNNDLSQRCFPHITLICSGSFHITNRDRQGNKICEAQFKNIPENSKITMDSENDLIYGLTSPNDFVNWEFLYLQNGFNQITTDAEGDITFSANYREVRRVIL